MIFENAYFDPPLAWFRGAFSRLAYFSTIRDSYTGIYAQEKKPVQGSAAAIHQSLQAAHQETFSSVIELPIESLCREMKNYLVELTDRHQVRKIAAVWLDIEPYLDMVPAACSPFDRRLFQSRIRVALDILVSASDIPFLALDFPAGPAALQCLPIDPRRQRHRDN